MKFRLWPSGHSEDYTLIAKFKIQKDAEEGEMNLQCLIEDMKKHPRRYETDWEPEDASVSRDGSAVHFYVYSVGYLDDITAILGRTGKSPDIGVYQYYQELTVTIPLPENATLEHYMLIADKKESAIIKELKSAAKAFTNAKRKAVFEYSGDKIYDTGMEKLYLGDEEFDVPKGWQIDVMVGEGN